MEKMGREVGPVSPTITVFFREAFPKRGTWAGGLLILEPHQEVLPTQPGSHQIRGGCNGTHWLLLKKKKKKKPRRAPNITVRLSAGDSKQGKSFMAG